VQFGAFVGNALQGEFGMSLRQGRKVSTLIAERLPATLELSLAAALIALLVGIPLGVYAALRARPLAQAMMGLSLLGVSLPTFLIGILLILVFAVLLKWLPSFGRGDTVAWGLDHRPADRRRLEAPGAAGDHAVGLPAGADHAAGARRDAGGAAHRLHQVRPARGLSNRASTSAMR
jgi:ABC-type dipeptide/oligopeptide/nickel transport system permease component